MREKGMKGRTPPDPLSEGEKGGGKEQSREGSRGIV